MTEPLTGFETRLAAALRERAERGVSGADPAVVARSVIRERQPSRLAGLLFRLNPRQRLAWLTIALVVAAVLLAATLLIGVARPARIGILAVATSNGVELVNAGDRTARLISPSGAGAQSRSSDGWWTTYLSWSPDGSWLAYQSDRGTVRLVRPDGSSDHLLATGRSIDGAQAAEWSPDSTKLALHNDATNVIDLIDVTNGAETRLTPDVGLRMFAPRWSPDGHQILMSGQDALGDVELYLIDAPGTNMRKLTVKHEIFSAGEWSPDGRRIAYTDQSASDAEGRLYVMNADGTGVRPLKVDTHGQFFGVWSPDGGEMAYNGHDPSPETW
jgi:WD40 repeat protein